MDFKQKKPIQPEVFSPVPTFFNVGLISIDKRKRQQIYTDCPGREETKCWAGYRDFCQLARWVGGWENLYHPQPGTHGHTVAKLETIHAVLPHNYNQSHPKANNKNNSHKKNKICKLFC
jgi:hypothetical protein